jgi:hypothetical protein
LRRNDAAMRSIAGIQIFISNRDAYKINKEATLK